MFFPGTEGHLSSGVALGAPRGRVQVSNSDLRFTLVVVIVYQGVKACQDLPPFLLDSNASTLHTHGVGYLLG